MNTVRLEYFLFPHTSLGDADARRLSLMVPRLHLLQILDRPVLPGWADERIPGWKAIRDDALLARTRSLLKELRDLAQIHGYGGALASMSARWREEALESRTGIQSELRGKQPADVDAKQALLMEAAIFMEMAQELDEKERDLEAITASSDRMEADLQKMLGVSADDDLGEAAEMLSPPLAAGKKDVLYMLANRIAYWSRLFLNEPVPGRTVLVALSREVAEEVLDLVGARFEKSGLALAVEELELASIPAPDLLPEEAFAALLADVQESGVAGSFAGGLDRLIVAPRDETAREELDRACKVLGGRILRSTGKGGIRDGGTVRMTLMKIDFEGNDAGLWECLDKESAGLRGEQTPAPPAGILYLSEI